MLKPISKLDYIREFLKLESASGIILIGAMLLALFSANSPISNSYLKFLEIPVGIQFGPLIINKPLLLWINDGFMAVFFLLIGLEVKREVMEGQLSDISQITLPGIAATGGMLVPASIYAWFNWGDPLALSGWAIPAATDIAFALGILSLFGKRVPTYLKLYLMTLAIIDDLGAIIIIAVFYTSDLSIVSLVLAFVTLTTLVLLNYMGVVRIAAYIILGIILWVTVLKSGVHATLAGVALAFTIPMRAETAEGRSPLLHLEHGLHPWVAYGILPLFAFANAGVSLEGLSLSTFLKPVPLGIAGGLFLGKQLGVFGFSWTAIKLGWAKLPDDIKWFELYGVSVLTGIGFTMSLFIGTLAFIEHEGGGYAKEAQLGVLGGSLLAAIMGYAILSFALSRKNRLEN